MDSTMPGGASRCNNTRREPIGGVGSKNTDRNKTEPIRSNQEWSPCSGRAGVQSPPEADGVELRFFADRSLNEIAELTERPLSTVKTQLYRGLARLRRAMEATR